MNPLPAWLQPPPVYARPKSEEPMKHPETASLTKDARIATGLTQVQFAALIHSTKRTVAAWESGEKPPGTLAQSVLRAVVDGKWPIKDDPRCPYCDGTGDVHRADGEWLGGCGCEWRQK